MVDLQEALISCRDIMTCTGHSAKTVMHVWIQGIEEGCKQRQGYCAIVTTTSDDCHLVRMAMTECKALSTMLSTC